MDRSDVAVALLSDTPESGAHLREALLALGAPVVYETSTHALDRAALERSHANVVVINLDPHSGPHLDDLSGLLADTRYRVVFNDAEVSSALSGWDQARWARHLAAKVLGDGDLDPPRPADAEPVPLRETAPLAIAATFSALADDAPSAADIAPESTAPEPLVAARVHVPDLGSGLDLVVDDVDANVDEEVEKLLLEPFDLNDFDDAASFDVAAGDVAAEHAAAVPVAREAKDEFGAIDFDAAPIDSASIDSTPIEDFDVQEFAIDPALLAAFDEDPPPATKTTEIEPIEASSWSLEELLDSSETQAAPEAKATTAAPFGIETLSAAEYLAPAADEANVPPPITAPDGGLMLELIPLEEAVAPASVESAARESWLDPDAIAAPAKVRRVWVLGASIGGPESVREFLAELPRDYPALFLLAQHLGGEFVDLMTRQLAKATPLTVRAPTHGERVGHGEVAVVPATHRMQVDADGVVVLERDTEKAEYSPSIDRVLRDVADRFGDAAGAIIFSGMSNDAAEGCRYLAAKGGRVYAQEPDTCVVSAMVDGVRETGVVGFVGSPRELAEQLLAESKQSELRQGN